MIFSGRYGSVKYDPAGVSPVLLIALNAWKASFKTPKSKVTCFGDLNEVYVPGLPDVNGSIGGFWDSTNVVLFAATRATTPGMLELCPNTNEPTYKFSGLAYLDCDLDVKVDGPPTVSGTWMAAGTWTEYP